MFKVKLTDALKIVNSKKTFICFNIDQGIIKDVILTRNYLRYYPAARTNFRLLDNAKKDIYNNLKIE